MYFVWHKEVSDIAEAYSKVELIVLFDGFSLFNYLLHLWDK